MSNPQVGITGPGGEPMAQGGNTEYRWLFAEKASSVLKWCVIKNVGTANEAGLQM